MKEEAVRDLRGAIRKGAAMLDEREPGWRDRVAPGELDMEDCWACVLGQIFGEYTKGIFQLGEDAIFTRAFAAGAGEYPSLNREWLGYLKGEWS